MNLISVHSKNQLLSAIVLKRYFYNFDAVDLVIWNEFPDALNIHSRLVSANIFNNIYILNPRDAVLPIELRYKWFREFYTCVSNLGREDLLVSALNSNNVYLSTAYYEDTSDIYTATRMKASKVFLYHPWAFQLPITAYELPRVLSADTRDTCNYIFGYMHNTNLARYNQMILIGRHKLLITEARAVTTRYDIGREDTLVALGDTINMHPYTGEHINVAHLDYPLPLLYINGDLEGKELIIYEPLAVDNLSLLVGQDVSIKIHAGWHTEDNDQHYKSLKRIYAAYPNITFVE